MTELERLELILARVYGDLSKTTRFGASDELYVLQKIIEALTTENIRRVNQTNNRPDPPVG